MCIRDRDICRQLVERKEEVALLLSDQRMPGMSGVDLCRAIRRKNRTPIIVLSVRDQEHTKVEALDAGAVSYTHLYPFLPSVTLICRILLSCRGSLGAYVIS